MKTLNTKSRYDSCSGNRGLPNLIHISSRISCVHDGALAADVGAKSVAPLDTMNWR